MRSSVSSNLQFPQALLFLLFFLVQHPSYNINKYEAGYVLFRFIDSVSLGSNLCFDLSLVLGSVSIYSHR
ncbi:hypothetical protein LWI28_021205 [Acer negundo]|uniref:Secreted protein n=1 Tax=Acer negundo TaxID=4023 RepID=A0AAD5P3J8_ACENE|nr:hypothetical protein LWI28_021205 [Acer negundo]KAK4858990.1 hypothetical protein QYF36_024940 [Acer negundo]